MARGTLGGVIPGWLAAADEVRCVRTVPGTPGLRELWPTWVPDEVLDAVQAAGVRAPWRHQVEAAEAAFGGRHVAISTGTASGKSLAYLLPILAATYGGDEACVGVETVSLRNRLLLPRRRHTALYLAPTKALAHDQLRACHELGLSRWRVGTLDGDSPSDERRFAREAATYVLTNPDMLHRSVLPSHGRWAGLLQSLRYIVVDEAHRYRGVFGAHVAQVLRRLRRLCALYGSHPVLICASATASNAAEAAARLIGEDVAAICHVEQDFSRRGERSTVLWAPAGDTHADTTSLLARLVDEGRQTIAFVPSRASAELVAVRAQDRLTGPARIAAYRAGYLADDRRALERDLQSGELAGVAATNALELGVDVSGMDAVIIAGFPGTLSALRQQIGRAGRGDKDALAVVVAKPDPLDSYLFDHPELVFDTPVETIVLHPDNPQILGPHLCAAAQEAPLTAADERWFGPSMPQVADRLARCDLLRARPQGWFWTRPERAVDGIDLRSMGGRPVDIVDRSTGRVIGSVDEAAADRTVFPGAVYLHQGEQWVVESWDVDAHEALVRWDRPGYYTQAQALSDVSILADEASRPLPAAELHVGQVELSTHVTSYLRRDEITGDVWDETPLDLPVRRLRTDAMWWVLPPDLTAALGLTGIELGAAAHAAEHCAIGLLPVFAPCDRWDIGGLSTPMHPDTGCCTVFIHDGHPGGAGFARAGFARADEWLAATLDRLRTCDCEAGCPRCVVSPKCGNANQHLDKDAAAVLVDGLLHGPR